MNNIIISLLLTSSIYCINDSIDSINTEITNEGNIVDISSSTNGRQNDNEINPNVSIDTLHIKLPLGDNCIIGK